jgi:hypothetical protein
VSGLVCVAADPHRVVGVHIMFTQSSVLWVQRMPSIFGHQAIAVTCHDRLENCQLNLEQTTRNVPDSSDENGVLYR